MEYYYLYIIDFLLHLVLVVLVTVFDYVSRVNYIDNEFLHYIQLYIYY